METRRHASFTQSVVFVFVSIFIFTSPASAAQLHLRTTTDKEIYSLGDEVNWTIWAWASTGDNRGITHVKVDLNDNRNETLNPAFTIGEGMDREFVDTQFTLEEKFLVEGAGDPCQAPPRLRNLGALQYLGKKLDFGNDGEEKLLAKGSYTVTKSGTHYINISIVQASYWPDETSMPMYFSPGDNFPAEFEVVYDADVNEDLFVNYEDFAGLGIRWLAEDCNSINDWCSRADIDHSGEVEPNDISIMGIQWLTGIDPTQMAYIPGGEFEMGDHFAPEGFDDELPVHALLVDSFFISKYEITNQQYCDYLNSAYPAQLKVVGGFVYASSDNGNSYRYFDTHSVDWESQIDFSDPNFSVMSKSGRDMSADPVVEVSWYGAVAYCNWRSSQEDYESCYNLSTWECDFSKNGYRLATEAEWEYAARGGQHNPYGRFPWSDPNISHSRENYYADPSYTYDENPTEGYHPDWNDGINPYTSVVGSFASNGYGLYDMAGNVFEWCNDWYASDYYNTSPYDNPTGPTSGTSRIMRGGCWDCFAPFVRVSCRIGGAGPGDTDPLIGFRIVLDLN